MSKRAKKEVDPNEVITKTLSTNTTKTFPKKIEIETVSTVEIIGGEHYSASMCFTGTREQYDKCEIHKGKIKGNGTCVLRMTIPSTVTSIQLENFSSVTVANVDAPKLSISTAYNRDTIRQLSMTDCSIESVCTNSSQLLSISLTRVQFEDFVYIDAIAGGFIFKDVTFKKSLIVKTINGDISLENVKALPHLIMKFSTVNGHVVCKEIRTRCNIDSTNQSVTANNCLNMDVFSINGSLYGSGDVKPYFWTWFGEDHFQVIDPPTTTEVASQE